MARISMPVLQRNGAEYLNQVFADVVNSRGGKHIGDEEKKLAVGQLRAQGHDEIADAVDNFFRLARAKYGTVTLNTIKKSIAYGMKQIERANNDRSYYLDDREQAALAKTWKSLVEMAQTARGRSIDRLFPSGE